MSVYYASRWGVTPKPISSQVRVLTPMRDSLVVEQVYIGYMVTLQGFDTWVDSILLDMLDFNIILGIEWLAPHHVVLHCYAKTVTLVILRISPLIWQGSMSHVPMGIISYIQAKRLIAVGCSAYLAHVRNVIAETPTVEFVLVVCAFPNVFPVDLPRLPLEQEVDFVIEVELNTKPISIHPYKIAPAELKELSTQL